MLDPYDRNCPEEFKREAWGGGKRLREVLWETDRHRAMCYGVERASDVPLRTGSLLAREIIWEGGRDDPEGV